MTNYINTPDWKCGCLVMTVIFIIQFLFFFVLYNEADTLNEFSIRYDEKCKATRAADTPCAIAFTPDVDLKNPKVYYRLNNFY